MVLEVQDQGTSMVEQGPSSSSKLIPFHCVPYMVEGARELCGVSFKGGNPLEDGVLMT